MLIFLEYTCQYLTSISMANSFGEKIRLLRENNALLQKQVALHLDIDGPMLSKIEKGERMAKKEQVLLLAGIFGVESGELMAVWLADRLLRVVEDEPVALDALLLAEAEIKFANGRLI